MGNFVCGNTSLPFIWQFIFSFIALLTYLSLPVCFVLVYFSFTQQARSERLCRSYSFVQHSLIPGDFHFSLFFFSNGHESVWERDVCRGFCVTSVRSQFLHPFDKKIVCFFCLCTFSYCAFYIFNWNYIAKIKVNETVNIQNTDTVVLCFRLVSTQD